LAIGTKNLVAVAVAAGGNRSELFLISQ